MAKLAFMAFTHPIVAVLASTIVAVRKLGAAFMGRRFLAIILMGLS